MDLEILELNDKEMIHINTKKRKCKICGTKLTIYNLNKYCFAHLAEGRDKDEQVQDRIERERLCAKRQKNSLRLRIIRDSIKRTIKPKEKKRRPSSSKVN